MGKKKKGNEKSVVWVWHDLDGYRISAMEPKRRLTKYCRAYWEKKCPSVWFCKKTFEAYFPLFKLHKGEVGKIVKTSDGLTYELKGGE